MLVAVLAVVDDLLASVKLNVWGANVATSVDYSDAFSNL